MPKDIASSLKAGGKTSVVKTRRAKATEAEAIQLHSEMEKIAETALPSRIENVLLLNFDHMLVEGGPHHHTKIDRKIQYFFLSGGRQIRDEFKARKVVRCLSDDKNYFLAAKHQIELQSEQVMSFKRCCAAASLSLLKQLGVTDEMMIHNVSPADEAKLYYSGIKIKSSLAVAHSIDETYYIHYLYSAGTDYLVKYYPKSVLGILIWRYINREKIFTEMAEEDKKAAHKDLRTAIVYINDHEKGAEGFMEENKEGISRVVTHLARIASDVSGGRTAMALTFSKKLDYFIQLYHQTVKLKQIEESQQASASTSRLSQF